MFLYHAKIFIGKGGKSNQKVENEINFNYFLLISMLDWLKASDFTLVFINLKDLSVFWESYCWFWYLSEGMCSIHWTVLVILVIVVPISSMNKFWGILWKYRYVFNGKFSYQKNDTIVYLLTFIFLYLIYRKKYILRIKCNL